MSSLFTQRSHPACKQGHNLTNTVVCSSWLRLPLQGRFHRLHSHTCTNFLDGSWTNNL